MSSGFRSQMSKEMWVASAYRDGKGAEFRWFTDESEALRAAGIEDQPGE